MKISPARASRSGFTLLEILIVLVIIAILVGLAVPTYEPSIEKMRGVEALRHLTATRESLMRYHSQNGSYVGATIPLLSQGTLDYNPNMDGGQGGMFRYEFIAAPAASAFTLRATRIAIAGCGGAPVGTIRLDQAGNVTPTGVYV